MSANDSMTLSDLIKKLEEATPHLEKKAADIVQHNKAWTLQSGETGLDVVRRGGHAAVLGIGIMDFLCWAFGEGDKGYTPSDGLGRE